MAFPPASLATNNANDDVALNTHPALHNDANSAVNDIVSEIQTWTVGRDGGEQDIVNLGRAAIGAASLSATTQLLELGGSGTFTAGDHPTLVEFGSYQATFNATNGGSFVGIHITPTVLGNASVTEIVGIQSQVASTTDVTTQIHAVEALVNFGGSGKTATLSRSVWAQTVCAAGTITEGTCIDATGGAAGLGSITTMYGVRIGRAGGATLSLKGSTIYGIYVNQGSVRNYFGGDTRFGGGTNDEWAEYVGEIDANRLYVASQINVGASTTTGSPEIQSEATRTLSTTGSYFGISLVGSKTFQTQANSTYYAVHAAPALTVSTTVAEYRSFSSDATSSAGSANTVTAYYGAFLRTAAGSNVTATTMVGAYVNTHAALGTITTGIGVDIHSQNTLGTYTTAIGLRITDLAGGSTKWAMQVGDYQSYHHGQLTLGGTTAPAYALDLIGTAQNRGVIRLAEAAATPSNPAQSTGVLVYHKTDAIVFAFNDAGTMRYKYLTLTGTGVTWTHSTSAP